MAKFEVVAKVEDLRDVNAAVARSKRRETPRRLLQLALAADTVPASGLVPGDGHVDKPLEEILFPSVGGAPRIFERLVSGEELAAANQLEPLAEELRPRP